MKQISFVFSLFYGMVVFPIGFKIQMPPVFGFMGTDIHLSLGLHGYIYLSFFCVFLVLPIQLLVVLIGF